MKKEEKVNQISILILEDYQNECFYPISQLKRGIPISKKLRILEDFFSDRFENNKTPVMVSLINLENKWRIRLQAEPLVVDPKIFKQKVKEFNSVIEEYNKIVKFTYSTKRVEEQKKILNKLSDLSYNLKRVPPFFDVFKKLQCV